MRGAGKIWLAVVAVVLVAAGCEWTHVRGDAALSGRSSAITTIGVANVNTVVPEWETAGVVASSGESPTLSGRWIQTQQGAYVLAPLGCSGSPIVCPPAWTRSGWTGPATGEAPPTQADQRSFVLPASSDAPGAATFAAFSADGTAGCAGSPLVCSPLWSAAATGVVPDGFNVGGVAAPTVAGSDVYVTTGTGHVLAYDATGVAGCAGAPVVCEPRWSAGGIESSAPVAVVGPTAFATGANDPANAIVGGLFAFAADGTGATCTGDPVVCEPLWRGQFGDGTAVLTADQVSPAAVVGGTAYVVAGSTLFAFATDGTTDCSGDPVVCAPRWSVDVGPTAATTRTAPAVVGDRVYVPRDGGITVVAAATGAPLAVLDAGAGSGSHASGVVIAGGLAWFGTTDGLVVFDAACATTCLPLLEQFSGHAVTTPAVSGDRVHVVVDGVLRTLVLPPAPPRAPIKLGNPRNYLGTGSLLSGPANTVSARENKWLAINGSCTRKAQGDRIAARYTGGGTNNCTGTANPEYDDTNYTIAVDLPPGRTESVDVVVFNGNYLATATGLVVSGNITMEFTPGGLPSGIPQMPTTFTLNQADATPDDDSDNVSMAAVNGCASTAPGTNGTKTFDTRTTNTPEDNYAVAIPNVADTNGYWLLCRIPPSAPAGRYPLRVRNQATATDAPSPNNGANNFGVLALPVSGGTLASPTGQRLCDTAGDASCPEVIADRFLSIMSLASGTAEPFLAQVPVTQAGQLLEIELWDPAEGAQSLGVLQPTGSSTWSSATFDWSAAATPGGTPFAQGTNVTSIDVMANNFNDALVTIRVRIPTTYNPTPLNEAWRIRMTSGAAATDRTTWSARVVETP